MGRRRSFTHSFVHFSFLDCSFLSIPSFSQSPSFPSFPPLLSLPSFHLLYFIPSFLHSFLHCELETPVMRFVTGSCCRIVACWRFPFTRHIEGICLCVVKTFRFWMRRISIQRVPKMSPPLVLLLHSSTTVSLELEWSMARFLGKVISERC